MLTFAQARPNIFAGESGGDYNALYNYQNREGGRFAGTRLTDMSVGDVMQFTDPRGEYAQYVRGQVGRTATPVGAYQVVGTTLRNAVDALGIDPSTPFNQATQDRIGEWIFSTQGTGAWEGYRGPQAGGQGMDGFVQQQPQDPMSSLSRGQRMMLGFAALRDAAASLEGEQSNFFGDAFTGIQQQQIQQQEIDVRRQESERLRRQGILQAIPELQRNIAMAQMMGQDVRPFEQALTAAYADLGIQPLQQPDMAAGAAGGAAPGAAAGEVSDLDRLYAQADQEQVLLGAVRPSTAAQIQRAEAAAEAQKQAEADLTRGATGGVDQLRTIGDLKGIIYDNPLTTTGLFASVLRDIPATNAYDAQAVVDTIIANAGFDRLQRMREESPTGGALGQVTVEELRMLQRTISNLDLNQSPERVMAQIENFEREYKNKIRAAYATSEDIPALDAALGGRPVWLEEDDTLQPQVEGNVTFSWD